MKKRNYLTLGLISLTGLAVGIVSLSAVNSFKFNADGPAATNWKHFKAVMPTETTQGIREYWINCAGEYQPYFTKPEGVSVDAIDLTQAQKDAILANPKDARIIPTLNRIQAGVDKKSYGVSPLDYTFVYDAYGYTYLDSTTKGLITDADAEAIVDAYDTFNESFKVVYDAGKDTLPGKDQEFVTITRGYDSTYGDVLEINTTEGMSGGTSQLYFYGLNSNGVTYGENDILNFSIYSPFAAGGNTTQTYWCGNYDTAKKITANPQAWTSISDKGKDLNTNNSFATSLGAAVSLQRYVNGTIDPYSGTYKMTSIIAELELTKDGTVVQSTLNNIAAAPNGSWPDASTITKNVSTDYGRAVKIDIPSKTTAVEFEWGGVDVKRAQNFDYLVVYVYAPVANEAFFFSQRSWRNAVMNIDVSPSDPTNGDKANTAATSTAILAAGWNKIVIPSSYFMENGYTTKANTMFFEMWARTTGEQNGWLVTDIKGYNSPDVRPVPSTNGYSYTGTVEAYEESTYPGVPFYKVSASATKVVGRFAAFVNRPFDLSKYSSVKFIVKGPRAGNFALYYDFVTNVWWPIGKQVTPSVTSDSYTEIVYNASDINTGFSWNNLKMGLLFIGSGNDATGDWYVGIQFIK